VYTGDVAVSGVAIEEEEEEEPHFKVFVFD